MYKSLHKQLQTGNTLYLVVITGGRWRATAVSSSARLFYWRKNPDSARILKRARFLISLTVRLRFKGLQISLLWDVTASLTHFNKCMITFNSALQFHLGSSKVERRTGNTRMPASGHRRADFICDLSPRLIHRFSSPACQGRD